MPPMNKYYLLLLSHLTHPTALVGKKQLLLSSSYEHIKPSEKTKKRGSTRMLLY